MAANTWGHAVLFLLCTDCQETQPNPSVAASAHCKLTYSTKAHLLVRALHADAAVESPRAQQGSVQHIGPVGGGDANHQLVLARVKAVQL